MGLFVAAVVVGVAVQVTGAVMDTTKHLRALKTGQHHHGSGTAEIFEASHIVIGIGVAIVFLAGLVAAFLVRRRRGAQTRLRLRPARVALGAVAVVAAAVFLGQLGPSATPRNAVNLGPLQPYARSTDRREMSKDLRVGSRQVKVDIHHGAVRDQWIDEQTRAQLAAQLVEARQAAMQLPRAQDALAAGYERVGPYIPFLGARYVNRSIATFDPARPAILVYAGDTRTAPVAGMAYLVAGNTPPEGFAGPNDRWRTSSDPCLVGDGTVTPAPCTNVGAGDEPKWLLNVWAVAGWDGPEGLFGDINSTLT